MKRLVLFFALLAVIIGGASFKAVAATDAARSESSGSRIFETALMDGFIGKYRIKMRLSLNQDNGTVTGWYYYTNKGSKYKIDLSGTVSGDVVYEPTVILKEKVNGKVTGTFKGEFSLAASGCYSYEGKWTSPTGETLNFEVGLYRDR